MKSYGFIKKTYKIISYGIIAILFTEQAIIAFGFLLFKMYAYKGKVKIKKKHRYPTFKLLKQHSQHHNPANARMCDQCGKIVRTSNTLNKHKQVVHGIKPPKPQLQCKICNNWYTGKGNLQHHINNIHYSEKKRNVCEICGFVSTTRAAKLKHIIYRHRSDKRHECTVCKRTFKVPNLLKEHMATHTGVDLYKCTYCPNTFKSKSNMYNHCKRFHAEEFEKRNKRIRVPK